MEDGCGDYVLEASTCIPGGRGAQSWLSLCPHVPDGNDTGVLAVYAVPVGNRHRDLGLFLFGVVPEGNG